MLNHPTLDKLKTLKLYGMIQGLLNQAQHPAKNLSDFIGQQQRVFKPTIKPGSIRQDIRFRTTFAIIQYPYSSRQF